MTRRFSLKSLFKWMYPGMRIKRWGFLAFLGVVLIFTGATGLTAFPKEFSEIIKAVYYGNIFIGVVLMILGFKNMMMSVVTQIMPSQHGRLIDILYQKRFLEHGPRIVVIGGGTGLSMLLHGLKEYTSNITAVVTVADDGGSSGRLRKQFDIVAPGDIRNCLVALADDEMTMRDLFQYRFDKETEFSGHSFGNLFLTALTQVTGDFEKAVKESSKILAIRGRVLPSTLEKVVLAAEHADGRTTQGEAEIPKTGSPIRKIYIRPSNAHAAPEVIKAIGEAELVILGPGSLYTSIIPNLLIQEIRQAVAAAQVSKLYVCNIMTQPGETTDFKASDHVRELVAQTDARVLDAVIVNTGRIPASLREKYARERSVLVEPDSGRIRDFGYAVIEEDLVSAQDHVRHDSTKLARIIASLLNLERRAGA
ncbi:MAG: gluconeogenesis factor YvcK family protein [Deltaproteobacteria bacterium]